MKVIVAIIFAIGSVSALGSGPYLPSGWRPSGPSFYLPSEVAKPADSPLKETLFQETEASGSDALREYGPPKVEAVVQYSVNQGLPDVATEQTFFVQSLATQELQAGAGETVAVEVNTESAAIVEEVASTAQAIAENVEQAEVISEVQPTLAAVAEVVEQTEAVQAVETTDAAQAVAATEAAQAVEVTGAAQVVEATEATQAVDVTEAAQAGEVTASAQAVGATEAALAEIVEPTAAVQEEVVSQAVVAQEVVPTVVVEEAVPISAVEQLVVEKVAEGVNNIAEAIIKLESEAAAEAVESAVEIKQDISGSLQQAPEGFLEYGPPGFLEYGPPKSAAVEAAPVNNEVRRRRFSPKFKSHKKH